ncbi:potassium channel family protein [Citricoccus sp. K5]|uniref:potassium channel family protein n=1 Tax=Citricoccus sp. K5 TaxID=2653135 RepID=UPI0012F0DFDB|nr:potassium channel family protein [Citricoccus sp. K5]VXB69424.1 Two pore domain potassium channel family protein [Citricoccus sp. K5]
MHPGKGQRRFRDLDRPGQWRAGGSAALRVTTILTVVFLVYFIVPVDGFNAANSAGAWIRLAAVVLVFLCFLGLQVRLVFAAGLPMIRAAEAVVESLMSFLCLFALLHLSMSTTDPASFSEPLDRMDALYFTVSTFATVGFGDVVPLTRLARLIVTVQVLLGLGVLVMIAKVSFYAAKEGLRRSL